jgi:ribosomal protein S6 kinase alpha-5
MKVVSKSKVNEKNRDILSFELQVMTEVTPSPFLQKCHLAFENNFNIYFILDLHQGGDLFHHLLQRCLKGFNGLEENEVKIILSEVYLALEHLHNHNIIHRDIKIENIMLDKSGHVKLIDFGLSTQLSQPIESMSPVGSFIYMAPELIRDHQGGRHTDWWSMGVMAFELLTGRTPWSTLTDQRIIKHEIQTVNVAQYLIDFSPNVSSFINSLMNKNFLNRLGTKQDEEIMRAPFFKSINWIETRKQESKPALIPEEVCTSEEARNAALDSYYQLQSRKTAPDDGYETWSMGLDNADDFLVI